MAKPRKNSTAAAAANSNNAATAGDVGARVKPKRTRKSVPRESPSQRSSIYRGVTRHRWTGRFEAHLWDKNSWNESQNKKGKQVYLGAYDDEEAAARAYDLAALKYWGPDTILNFPASVYEEELKEMEGQSREEYIGSLRRRSSGFSRGVSKYRGVARHHHNGRWEARIGRVLGNKYLYLGTYATQEEAAVAYDIAAIEHRGLNAVTNFDITRYDVDKIMASNTLLPGELARRKKDDEAGGAVPAAVDGGVVTTATLAAQAANANDAVAADTWKVAAALAAAPRAAEHGHGAHHHHHHDVLSRAEAFSVLHDLVTAADGGGGHHHSAAGGGAAHHMPMSSASSLVTSLGNSREGSPDRGGGLSMLFSKPPAPAPAHQQTANKPMSPLMPLGSWASPASARAAAAVSIAHMPMFAAWTDA